MTTIRMFPKEFRIAASRCNSGRLCIAIRRTGSYNHGRKAAEKMRQGTGATMRSARLPVNLQRVDVVAALDLILARMCERIDSDIVFVPARG